MNLLLDLNHEQAEAVRHGEGPLLIIAGPGTGKTRVITYRIAHLIRQQNIAPEQILAITFTNKAAQEMRRRVETLLGATGLSVWIDTFHAACTRILRRHGAQDGLNPHFAIFDQEIQEEVLSESLRELGLDPKQYPLWSVRDWLRRQKAHTGNGPAEPDDARLTELAALYSEKLDGYQALDFDDLILRTVRLLRQQAEVRDHYHERIHYLLVDEYQDINQAQYNLLCLLTNPQRNITVVADADQAIYSWRGSDPSFIECFREGFDPKVIELGNHYRSTQNILRTAQSLIARNRPNPTHTLSTQNELGTAIYHYRVPTADEEVRMVIRLIQQLVEQRRYSYGDIAIFYRTHRLADRLEDALTRERVPLQRVHQRNTFQRERMRDIVACLRYLRWQLDRDLLVALNYPRQRLGSLALARVRSLVRQRLMPLGDLIRRSDQIHLGPATRVSLTQFLDRLDAQRVPRTPDTPEPRAMDVVRSLFDLLGQERALERWSVGALEPSAPVPQRPRPERGLRLAADSLFRAVQLGEMIHVTCEPSIEGVLATTLLDQVLRGYLDVAPEIHMLEAGERLDEPLLAGTHILVGDSPEVGADVPVIRLAHTECQIEEHILLQDRNLAFVAWRLCQRLLHYFEATRFEGCTICAFRVQGKDPRRAEIVEIAASKLDATGRSVEHYHTRIRPRAGTPAGWSQEEALRAPSMEEVLPDFLSFLEGQILVGHGLSDLAFPVLERDLRAYLQQGPRFEVYDTFEVARRLYPRQNCRIGALADRLGLSLESPDDPLEEASLVHRIFLHVVRAEQGKRQLAMLEEMLPLVVLASQDAEPELGPAAVRYVRQHPFDMGSVRRRLSESDTQLLETRWEELKQARLERTPEDEQWQQMRSEFLNRVTQFEQLSRDKGLEAFLDYQSLLTSSDEAADRDRVSLMTLHSAKGTEFPVVIMIGMDEGVFPLHTAEEARLEEERRLCYVGMTRAKERLYLISVRHRDSDQAHRPSRFIREVPKPYIRYWSPEESH